MDVKIIQQREVDIEGRTTNILNYLEITIEGVNGGKAENVTSRAEYDVGLLSPFMKASFYRQKRGSKGKNRGILAY